MKLSWILLISALLVASAFAKPSALAEAEAKAEPATPKLKTELEFESKAQELSAKDEDDDDEVSNRQSRQSVCYNQFQCSSGECITKTLLCNGRRDCSDGSDESSSICQPTTTSTTRRTFAPPQHPASCIRGEFTCRSGECIDMSNICDGYSDCGDGSDEEDSICPLSDNNGLPLNSGKGGSGSNGGTGGTGGSGSTGSIGGNTASQTIRPSQRLSSGENTGTWQNSLTPCNVPPQPRDGRWRLHRSQCDSNRECDAPKVIRSMEPGTYLVYTCNPGFIHNGNRDVLCGPNGQWIREPVCEEIKCRDLSSSATEALCTWNNVAVSCEVPAPVGTTARLNCRNGFVQDVKYTQTYRNVTCLPDGKWSPDPIDCVRKPKKIKLILEGDMILQGEL